LNLEYRTILIAFSFYRDYYDGDLLVDINYDLLNIYFLPVKILILHIVNKS